MLRRSSARKQSQSRQHENSLQDRARPQVSLVARKPQVALVAGKPSRLALSRIRHNIIPFRAQLGAVRGRTEQLVSTLQERTALWNSIQRDVRENRKAYREGNLVPFANPEHAHAAYESLLESLDTVLRQYRTLYGDMLDEFEFLWHSPIRRQYQDFEARWRRIYGIFRYLKQQRAESYQLTTELKDLAKVTHSIITRDALFFEHVTRLTAFKQNFHVVSRGWDGIKRALYKEGDRTTQGVQRKLQLNQINAWRSEVSAGKAAVKEHLDKKLSRSNPPLFHMKRAIDFFHSLSRTSSATIFRMEDIALFYQTESKKWAPYKSKYLWISACIDTWRTHNNESGSVFRGVAFYIAAHVRHKYGSTSSDELSKHASQLPLYVLHGLAIEEHRAAMGPVPYPKLRPGSSGIFPEVHTDKKGYPIMEDLYHTEEIGRAIEIPELAAMKDSPQATTIDTQDHGPGSAILEDTDGQQDAGMLWDDYDLPDVDDISFRSSHERVQNFHYGHMIRQRKSTLETIRSQPEKHMDYGHLDAVATYATLFREQVARLNEQKIDPSSRSTDASSLLPVAVPQAWQSAYRRRSRLRPKKYGDMLRQFQGLPQSTDTYKEPQASSRAQAESHARSAMVKNSRVAGNPQVLPRVEVAPASATEPDYSAVPVRSALGSVLDDFLYPDASARIRGTAYQSRGERVAGATSPVIRHMAPRGAPLLSRQDGVISRRASPLPPTTEPPSSSLPVVDPEVSSSSPAATPLRKQLDTLHLHIEGLIKIKLELEKLHAKETQAVVLTADSHVVSASPLEPRDEAAPLPNPEDLYDTYRKRRAARTREYFEARILQKPITERKQKDDLLEKDASSASRRHSMDIQQEPAVEPEQESSLRDSSLSTSRGQEDAPSEPSPGFQGVTRKVQRKPSRLVRFPVRRDDPPWTSQELAIEPEEESHLDDGPVSTSRCRTLDITKESAIEPERKSHLHDSLIFASQGQVDAASVPSRNTPRVARTIQRNPKRLVRSSVGRGDILGTSQGPAMELFGSDDRLYEDRLSTSRARVPNNPRMSIMEPKGTSELHDSSDSTSRGHYPDPSEEPAITFEQRSRPGTSFTPGSTTSEINSPCPNCFSANHITDTSCEKCGAPLMLAKSSDRTRRLAARFWTHKNAISANAAAQRPDGPTSFEYLFERELERRAASGDGVVAGTEQTKQTGDD